MAFIMKEMKMKIVYLFTKVPLIKIVCKESYKEILRFNDGFNVSWCSGVIIMCLDLGDPRAQTQWEAQTTRQKHIVFTVRIL